MKLHLIKLLVLILCIFQITLAKSLNEYPKHNELAEEAQKYRTKYVKEIISYMNFKADPCEDFYEYSCGNWKNVKKGRPTTLHDSSADIYFDIADQLEPLLQQSANELGIGEYSYEWELT